MAVLAIFSGAITKSQYEALRKEVQWVTRLAPGGIFHAASFDDKDHLHVADVWDSAEAMGALSNSAYCPR